jgi:hypothetical protein
MMVIHGDNKDKWTNNYAFMHHLNDYVISVSNFIFEKPSQNTTYTHIPTMLVDRGSVCVSPSISTLPTHHNNVMQNNFRFCKKQLLYVGRISEEKRSHLVCEYICNHVIKSGETDTCAVLIGDYYFSENRPQCTCRFVL